MITPCQYSLGELITALENFHPARTVPVGIANPHSFRGDYSELAFEPAPASTVAEMLTVAKSALGRTFQGWKGGDYVMDEHTPVWFEMEGSGDGETIGPVMLGLLLPELGSTPEVSR